LFSTQEGKFIEVDERRMVRFLPLGL
jgi:hypothetical protein